MLPFKLWSYFCAGKLLICRQTEDQEYSRNQMPTTYEIRSSIHLCIRHNECAKFMKDAKLCTMINGTCKCLWWINASSWSYIREQIHSPAFCRHITLTLWNYNSSQDVELKIILLVKCDRLMWFKSLLEPSTMKVYRTWYYQVLQQWWKLHSKVSYAVLQMTIKMFDIFCS